MDFNPENINHIEKMSKLTNWVDFAKFRKEFEVDFMSNGNGNGNGDITPTVIVERDNQALAIVMAPSVDKELGLACAKLCKVGFDADHLTLIVDARLHKSAFNMTPEELSEKFPQGSMQKLCEEGKQEESGIIDCLVCHRISKNCEIELILLPYSCSGKGTLKWLDSEINPSSNDVQGVIPDALREIMKLDVQKGLQKILDISKNFQDYSPERSRFHLSRAMITVLTREKFFVIDLISGRHPEWTDAKDKAILLIDKMIKDGSFPREAKIPLEKIMEQIGTSSFRDELTKLLNDNSYWLPSEIRQEIPNFVVNFENFCISVGSIEDFDRTLSEAKNKRVRVWSGNQTEYLGEGTYEGDVDVYFIEMPDGSIESNSNAEIEPTDVPDGCQVKHIKNNPKFVLDNGQTVYGCQVWWEFVKEIKEIKPKSAKSQTFSGKFKYNKCKSPYEKDEEL